MTLSKIDLLNKKFSRGLMGYKCEEVDQLLVEMAEALGEAADQKRELARKAKRLEAQLVDYKDRDETLRDTLMSTQKMVEELKVAAGREADLIMDEAKGRAETALREAHARVERMQGDIENLRRHRNQFRVQLKSLIESHLHLLEAESSDREKLEELESKLMVLQKAE